jgi:hypothetical protein
MALVSNQYTLVPKYLTLHVIEVQEYLCEYQRKRLGKQQNCQGNTSAFASGLVDIGVTKGFRTYSEVQMTTVCTKARRPVSISMSCSSEIDFIAFRYVCLGFPSGMFNVATQHFTCALQACV